MRYFSLLLLLLMNPAWLWAGAEYDVYATMQNLYAESQQERLVVDDEYKRDRAVRHLVKKLAKFDDKGLGDVAGDKNKDDLALVKREIESLTYIYTHQVRPILLNNIKLKRRDKGAKLNRTDVSKLMFKTSYNHKTRKPIAGIFYYQQDIDDNFFSEKWVNAGLLVNFPELKEEPWVKEALQMDVELMALLRMHVEYMDGVRFTQHKMKKSAVQVDDTHVQSKVSALSAHQREKVVRKFIRKLERLDDDQPFMALKQDLEKLLETFEHTVKPVLVDNVNMRRKDMASRANRGDLISLFYPNSKNYKTGKPISSKLQHQEDGHMVGYLVENSALNYDAVVQKSLKMEAELMDLFKEHKAYLQHDKNLMY
ncbi:MAG: hypothetical protein Q9N67_11035 [Ghiorsea sp.]|nr:hypothetical protein [Ghiorsea sp.]